MRSPQNYANQRPRSMRGAARCLIGMKYHFPPSGRTFLTGASVWASLHFCILVRHMIGLMLRRGVRAGRRSSPAKRVYGLKPVSRVQISPSPPHTQVKRRVTVKGNSPFLRSSSSLTQDSAPVQLSANLISAQLRDYKELHGARSRQPRSSYPLAADKI